MANPLWIPGSTSANPKGRPRHSVRTVKGMVERFIKRNISPNKLQSMYNELTTKEQLNMLTELLPYVAAKQSTESLSSSDIDTLYDKLMQAIKSNEQQGNKAG